MAESRWDITKRLETGYADNQSNYPYWVRPWTHSVSEYVEIHMWVIKVFGHSDWSIPDCRYVASDRKYWFRDEADRTFFLLRWS